MLLILDWIFFGKVLAGIFIVAGITYIAYLNRSQLQEWIDSFVQNISVHARKFWRLIVTRITKKNVGKISKITKQNQEELEELLENDNNFVGLKLMYNTQTGKYTEEEAFYTRNVDSELERATKNGQQIQVQLV
jgi:hypothetical protein